MEGSTQILPFLFLGGKDESKSLTFLLRNEIGTILNMTPQLRDDPAGVPNYHEDDRRFRYHRLPLVDNTAESLLPTVKQAVELIERSRHYGNVLVHCRQGVSRSAAIVAAYLIRYRGMTLAAALAHMRRRRPVVRPNEAFLAQLERYEGDVAELRRLGGVVPHEPPSLVRAGTPDSAASAPAAAPVVPLAGSKRSVRESTEAAGPPLARGSRPRGGGPGELVGRGFLCEECGEARAAVRCDACNVAYCDACDSEVHGVPSIGDHVTRRKRLDADEHADDGASLSCSESVLEHVESPLYAGCVLPADSSAA